MAFFQKRCKFGGGSTGRAYKPEVANLEDRRLLTIGTVTAVADPKVLAPADGRVIPVTVTGTITQVIVQNLSGVRKAPPPARVLAAIQAQEARQPAPKTALGQVNDQFHEIAPQVRSPLHLTGTQTFFNPSTSSNPTAAVGLIRNFSYTLTVNLQASAGGQADGRHYNITVSASDRDGASGTTISVVVPHGPMLQNPRHKK